MVLVEQHFIQASPIKHFPHILRTSRSVLSLRAEASRIRIEGERANFWLDRLDRVFVKVFRYDLNPGAG
jgi:hypothetical protein